MQVAAPFEGENGIFVHSEVPSQLRSMSRKPFAVAFGIGIAAFHDQPECAENRVGGLEFVSEFLQTEQGLDPGRLWVGIGAGFTTRPLQVVRDGLSELQNVLPAPARVAVAAMGPKMCALAG